MPLSKKEIEKIYELRKKLQITFKAATTEDQKKRINNHIQQIEKIINYIEEGQSVDFDELNIFSDDIKLIEEQAEKRQFLDKDDRINYIAKVENLKIIDTNKDSELDQIYSFIMYFEKHFYTPLGANYLKLEYNLNKKRGTYFTHYDNLKILLSEFKDDLLVMNELKFKDQQEQYKLRLVHQKKHFLVKLSELLHELKDFFEEINSEIKAGRKVVHNPDEKYSYKYPTKEKTDFDNVEMIKIVEEVLFFIEDFIEILRMPDFRKISDKKIFNND